MSKLKKKYPFLKGDKSVYWAMKYPILSKQDWPKFRAFRKKENGQPSGVSRTCCDHWPQLTWTVKRNFANIVKAPSTHNAVWEIVPVQSNMVNLYAKLLEYLTSIKWRVPINKKIRPHLNAVIDCRDRWVVSHLKTK